VELQSVVALPGVATASSGVVVTVSLVETTGLLSSGGKSTGLAVLVDGLDDPVDAGVATDGLVLGVDEDDLEVLVGSVLVNPVGVYSQTNQSINPITQPIQLPVLITYSRLSSWRICVQHAPRRWSGGNAGTSTG
jgi:hypothetical protein